ncbi:Iron-binding zinc finger [Theobroma cacao]|uniref:CDGSH iron-sulfur domain-containing protein NEET n=1 Tax=Theobroma cacao TaxID=3641 RepID=A0AB32VZE3_THECC|nr:PREDICTED: CDGSH iron-sulfur domain-containing protein NEET [Theobroma cacao]WRX17612.1 Iron-binding zinc finger [Theobroma cacao]
MASTMSTYVAGFCHNLLSTAGPKRSPGVGVGVGVVTINARPKRSAAVVVRAEGQTINPEIRKTEEKVVDSVVVTELSKPLTAYCRCWRSGTFPLCDGSHVKHNKATGDNVGPLLLKKQ